MVVAQHEASHLVQHSDSQLCLIKKKKGVNALLHAAISILMQHLTPGLFLGHEVCDLTFIYQN